MFKISVKLLPVLTLTIPILIGAGRAQAATFSGEFWDASVSITSLATADSIIAGGPATATFMSSAIDYPQGFGGEGVGINIGGLNWASDTTPLSTFLGSDAGSLSGAGTSTLDQSVFRFTGFLNLAAGDQTFRVRSDDGFRLTVGGVVVSLFDGPHNFYDAVSATANPGVGITPFELIYFENAVNTGVEFMIDGVLAAPVSAVPVPAALPLFGTGLGLMGLLGWLRRRRVADAD